MNPEPQPIVNHPANAAGLTETGIGSAPNTSPPPKQDGRRFNGGKRAGAGIQKGTELSSKRTYDKLALAQTVTQAIITGQTSRDTSALPLTEQDKRLLQRISGLNVEAFNELIAIDLREIAALSAQAIKEALAERRFKPGELGFVYSVAHDKRLSLDGSRALNNAAVNVTVNNFGPTAKNTLLSELDGLSNAKQVQPIEVSA